MTGMSVRMARISRNASIPFHAGHLDVHDHDVNQVRVAAERLEAVQAVFRFKDGVTILFEDLTDEPPNGGVVVDDKDDAPTAGIPLGFFAQEGSFRQGFCLQLVISYFRFASVIVVPSTAGISPVSATSTAGAWPQRTRAAIWSNPSGRTLPPFLSSVLRAEAA